MSTFVGSMCLPSLELISICDNKNNYELAVAVQGFEKEDFKICTENGLLTINAEIISKQNEENENLIPNDISMSSFTRTFNLPDNITEDNMQANYHSGILTIDLKKFGERVGAKKMVKVE